MGFFKFEFDGQALVSKNTIEAMGKTLLPEIERINEARCKGYDTPYASINLPFDDELIKHVKAYVKKKEGLNLSVIVLIGIGGSNLGTVALHEALHGPYFNELHPKIKFYCADTVDSKKIAEIVHLVSQELDQGNRILIIVVTKSGTTLETIVNAATFLNLLKVKRPTDYHKYIVVTTDAGSPLEAFAQKEQCDILYIPKKVGGRYSVFSSVGLFPLGMLGIAIDELIVGARSALEICTSKDISKNVAAINAILKYVQYKNGLTIHNLFVFSTFLESVGKWYRQLIGESIGKEYNVNGKRVEVGITPTISVGTTDLHSVAQLYLGGPRTTFTTFVAQEDDTYAVDPTLLQEFGLDFMHSSEKNVGLPLMNIILKGVKTAYKKNRRPYCSITLPELSPYSLGQLLQMYMIEMMYLGYLLEVNPFDQPSVELYKKEVTIQLEELRL
jgi:glucose-6-phosphate isomerase